MSSRLCAASLAAFVCVMLGACGKQESAVPPPTSDSTAKATPAAAESTPSLAAEPAPQPNPDRNAYFGEEHIHTSWSVDAWLMGNRATGPDDALKYAQGET